jgi:hypothetical protein
LIDLGAWEKDSWHLKNKSKNLLVWKKKTKTSVSSFQQQGTSFCHPFLLNSRTWKVGHILELWRKLFTAKNTPPHSFFSSPNKKLSTNRLL